MIITIDIGNSRIKSAQWRDDVIVARNVVAYDEVEASDVDNNPIFDGLFESVQKPARVLAVCVAHDDLRTALEDWVQTHWQLEVEFLKTADRYGDIVNAYADPAKHGADRWAALVAAHQLVPDNPLCVISAGTAITFDLLEKGGQHLGGYILPSYNSMHLALLSDTADIKSFVNDPGETKHDTAVESGWHMQYHASANSAVAEGEAVPVNTRDAVEHGVHKMLQAGIRELCRSAQDRLGQSMKVVVTGGFAEQILAYRDMPEMIHQPDLVMQGLYLILSADEVKSSSQ